MISLASFGQKKDSTAKQPADTLVQITVKLNDFRALLYIIDQNVDSKRLSKDVIDLLSKSAQLVADKPKQLK